MIDGHIHYTASAGKERYLQLIGEQHLDAAALLCIPKGGTHPSEEDAFCFQKQCPVPVYVFGGLDRKLFYQDSLSSRLESEIFRLMDMGCTGIKMLEGKPDVRKQFPIPDFDHEVWEPYWDRLEQEQVPIYFHINDPEEFWDANAAADYVKKAGWLYDETYINNEAQYHQILQVLNRHPHLKICFPHFFFLSAQLPRLGRILDAYPNVRIDMTPGIELYYQLSAQGDQAKDWILDHQDRILYGTDIGARALIKAGPVPLHVQECRCRVKLIRDFLETDGQYLLEPDGYYVVEREPTVINGLGLSRSILDKIYGDNYLKFIKRD